MASKIQSGVRQLKEYSSAFVLHFQKVESFAWDRIKTEEIDVQMLRYNVVHFTSFYETLHDWEMPLQ